MKKLMIIAAVALSAAVGNAATAYWGFTNEYEGEDGANLSGFSAYLISQANWDSSNVGDSLAKAILTAPYADWSDDSDGEGYYAYSYSEKNEELSEDLVGDAQKYFIVLADDTNYAVSGLLTGDIKADGDNSQAAKFTDDTFSLASSDMTSYGTPEPPPGPEPGGVPEPTSGLLMLVGLAGIALRRRRA